MNTKYFLENYECHRLQKHSWSMLGDDVWSCFSYHSVCIEPAFNRTFEGVRPRSLNHVLTSSVYIEPNGLFCPQEIPQKLNIPVMFFSPILSRKKHAPFNIRHCIRLYNLWMKTLSVCSISSLFEKFHSRARFVACFVGNHGISSFLGILNLEPKLNLEPLKVEFRAAIRLSAIHAFIWLTSLPIFLSICIYF